MARLYGALGLQDSDRSFVNTIGQRAVFDAVQTLLSQYNAELNAAMRVFVDRETSDYKFRYYLPGGGKMQRRGRQSQAGAVKALGSWDVALPLEDFGDQLAADDVSMGYMTIEQLDRHIEGIFIADQNTVRFEMLKALFNSTQRTFIDELYGSLLVEPLANGDSVTYPPVLGSESEATDTHYLESGYLASAISDTNNPFVTGRDELEEHFGAVTGGSNIVAFINNAQTAKTSALTDFDPVNDRFIMPGEDTDQVRTMPSVPGRVIGRTDGVWVSEWRWIPANYILFVDLDAPPPLLKRVDPAETGLGTGLQLVTKDEIYPFEMSHYRHRYGFGAGNRLNGVVMELGTGGTYSIPSGYS